MATSTITANPLPLRGKYDARFKQRTRGGKRFNAGQKPRWAKHLTKNCAANVLKQADSKELWLQLLKSEDDRIRLQTLCYLTDRLEGKPFVAENPNASKASSAADPKLLVAIQNLIVAAKPTKPKRTKVIQATVKALPDAAAGDTGAAAEPAGGMTAEVIQAAAKPTTPDGK